MVIYQSPQKKQWINLVKTSSKTNQHNKAILNERIKKTNIYKADNIKTPKAKR